MQPGDPSAVTPIPPGLSVPSGPSAPGGASAARGFLALASGDGLARVIAFAASVYVARRLGASMFGVVGFASAVVLYFTHAAGLGVDLPGVRDVARDRERMARIAPGILTVRLLASLGLAALLAAGALLFLPQPEAGMLALFALTILPVGPNPRWIFLGWSETRPVAIARALGESLYLAGVLLLVRDGGDIGCVPWAQFLGDAAATALLLAWLRARGTALPFRLDWAEVRPVLARSFPLMLNILLGLLVYNSDLLFLRAFRDSAAVGWYAAAYQLISFLINMITLYSLSLLPLLSRASPAGGERGRLYAGSIAQSLAIGIPTAVGGAFVAPAIIALVFGPGYEPSGAPLAVLLFTVPFMLWRDIAQLALIVEGREKLVVRITFAAVVANAVMNVIVIPRWGIVGAAATTLATEVLRAVLADAAARKHGYPRVGISRLWRSTFAALAMAAALGWVWNGSLWSGLALGAASYAAALFVLGGIRLRRK